MKLTDKLPKPSFVEAHCYKLANVKKNNVQLQWLVIVFNKIEYVAYTNYQYQKEKICDAPMVLYWII